MSEPLQIALYFLRKKTNLLLMSEPPQIELYLMRKTLATQGLFSAAV
jgi:hypothetical protein